MRILNLMRVSERWSRGGGLSAQCKSNHFSVGVVRKIHVRMFLFSRSYVFFEMGLDQKQMMECKLFSHNIDHITIRHEFLKR